MQKQTILVFVLLAVIIAGALFSRLEYNELNRAREIELKRSGEALKKKDREIRLLLDSLHKQDLAAIKALQEATIRADRAEAEHNKIKARYDQIRFKPLSSDRERDSVIFAILHN